MATNKTSIPFNKDGATLWMLKKALEDIELLFDIVEQHEENNVSNKESDARLAGMVRQIYGNWQRKYPK